MKLRSILMALLLLLALATLAACGGGGETASEGSSESTPAEGELSFTVNVTDGAGAPVNDVILTLMQGEEEVFTRLVRKEGRVSFTAPGGDYTFTLTSTAGELYYDASLCTLTAAAPTATVAVTPYLTGEKSEIVAYSKATGADKVYAATRVGVGTFAVPLDRGERTYFIFTPEEAGLYEFSFSSRRRVEIGYYGTPVNVFRDTLAEAEDRTVSVEVHPTSLGGIQLVIGLDTAENGAEVCLFSVTRVRDYEETYIDLPFDIYEGDAVKHPHDYDNWTPTVTDLDVTDPALTVVLGEDGYYHLGSAEGPLVFLRVGSDSKYVDAFATMISKSHLCRYFFDEEGNFQKKESYHDYMAALVSVADRNGLVPLDEDLEYVIKSVGEYRGWWDLSGTGHIFGDDVPAEGRAWLFAACTVTFDKEGGKDASSPLSPRTEGAFRIGEGETLYYTAEKMAAAGETLVISDLQGILTVTYGGETYTANEKGEIRIPAVKGETLLAIASSAEGEIAYTVHNPRAEESL